MKSGILDMIVGRRAWAMYASVMLRSFANYVSGIFVPIYLYSSGYGFEAIGMYYLLFFSSLSMSLVASSPILKKHGTSLPMIIGTAISSIFYLMLGNGISVHFLAPIVGGIGEGIYYCGFNATLLSVTRKGHGGLEISMLSMASKTPSFFTLIGSLIIREFSFKASFVGASVIMLISSIFALLFGGKGKPVHVDILKRMAKDAETEWRMAYISSFSLLATTASIFWPLYIFMSTGSVLVTGAVRTLASIVSFAFMPVVGVLVDKLGTRLSHVSFVAYTTSIGISLWLPWLPVLALSDMAIKLLSAVFGIEEGKLSFEHRSSEEWLVLRELWLLGGRIAVILPSIILSSIYPIFVLPPAFFAMVFLADHLSRDGKEEIT